MEDEFTLEYSKRLGVLTGAQLQAALDRFDLGQLKNARPAPGGLFGQNVLISTSAGEYVLRGAPHYDGQFEKEAYFSRLVAERTPANAPWPFQIEKSPAIFGWSYAVMPMLPGIHLSDPEVRHALTPADKLGIARAMGSYLALIQQGTWDEPADYHHDRDVAVPLSAPFATWFAERTRTWLGMCRAVPDTTTDDDVAWIESMIAAAENGNAAPFPGVIVHTDFAEGNVVAERTDDGWRICGTFDLGDAFIGDGEYDLARLACWYGRMGDEMLHAFLGGYFEAHRARPGLHARLSLYIVADRVIFWEYGKRNKVWFENEPSFRAWAEPFLVPPEQLARYEGDRR